MYFTLLLILLTGFTSNHQTETSLLFNNDSSAYQEEPIPVFLKNKIIPEELLEPVTEALSYFPELEKIHISFEFRDKIGGSIMQAQPKFLSLFVDQKEKRKYRIKITRNLFLDDEVVPIEDVPYDALLGWIGHELGHIMDYLDRSSSNMMKFGMKYMMSNRSLTEAELTADGYAIGCGMGIHILANKNYILNNEFFEDIYKEKIRTLYMSPGQILSIQEMLGN